MAHAARHGQPRYASWRVRGDALVLDWGCFSDQWRHLLLLFFYLLTQQTHALQLSVLQKQAEKSPPRRPIVPAVFRLEFLHARHRLMLPSWTHRESCLRRSGWTRRPEERRIHHRRHKRKNSLKEKRDRRRPSQAEKPRRGKVWVRAPVKE